MRKNHHWTCWCLILLGLWQLFSPLFLHITTRGIIFSDEITGALLIVSGFLLQRFPRQLFFWGAALIGVWLQFSSLIFWAPTLVIYLNDLIVGALVIAFTIVFPICRDPSMLAPGWSYNPSTWLQRLPTAILAVIGWASSFYMAAYQLHYIDTIWDPFFPTGTLDVITSTISKSFPISDAGLGSASYVLEFLLTLSGGMLRWYRTPWMVILFGILVVPLSLVSITLIILQPVVVGAWCSWCLLTAICMLIMAALSIDEVVLVLQYLKHVRKSRLPFWTVFWEGSKGLSLKEEPPRAGKLQAMIWGFTPTGRLLCSMAAGLFLLFLPSIFSAYKDIDSVVGALVIVFSVIAMADAVRKWRFAVIGFAVLLATGALWIKAPLMPCLLHLALAAFLAGVNLSKGKTSESCSFRSQDTCKVA